MKYPIPIKATPAIADDMRPITDQERRYFKSMFDHYRDRCLSNPCNRMLREQMKVYLGYLESGVIATHGGFLGPEANATM